MNKQLTKILAGVFITIFGITGISESQIMKNGGLNTRQEKIVAIAAFTASGNLQKLETVLNQGVFHDLKT